MTIVARVVLVASVLSAPAYAQSPEAESLFREGKALLAKGKVAQACEKLEASDQIDRKAGTELNLGDCREKNKQLASAWATFLKAAATAKNENDPKRALEAKRRAKLLEPKLKYLTIKVADDRKYDGLEITRDGQPVDPAVWNQRVPVDQGTHDLVGKAPHRESWKEQVEVDEGDEVTELPELGEVAVPAEKVVVRPPPKPTMRTTERRYFGLTLVSAIAGVGGIGAGVGFGLRARSLGADADAKCPNKNCFDDAALALNKRAHTSALLANAGFVVGGLGLIGATVLWWKGRPSTEVVAIVPTVTSQEVGVALGGRF